MGRPLAKRFFGNRNVGSASVLTDDGIGGEGIAEINWSTLGAFRGNGTFGITGLAVPAPTLPGGVQATWNLVFDVEGVSTGAGNTNLSIGDTFGHASIPGFVAKVTNTGTNATFSVTTTGASRGDGLAYANLMADTQGLTLTKIAGSGTAATFLVDLNYRVKSAAIVEKGSGYTGAETFTATVTGNGGSQTAPAGTLVVTTDTGRQGGGGNAVTNQENAIIIRAKTTSVGTVQIGDIQAQKGSRRYKIKTADGTAVCKLVPTTTLAVGQAYLVATATGGTYYVTKLTSRRATLVAKTGDEALDGMSVHWTFGSPSATVVQIENV
jgi:hypothetical protein